MKSYRIIDNRLEEATFNKMIMMGNFTDIKIFDMCNIFIREFSDGILEDTFKLENLGETADYLNKCENILLTGNDYIIRHLLIQMYKLKNMEGFSK